MKDYPKEEVKEIIELACKLNGGKEIAPNFVLEQYEKQRQKEPVIVGCY